MPSKYETRRLEHVSSHLALFQHFMLLEIRGQSRGGPGRLNFTTTTCQGSQENIGTSPCSRTHLLRHMDKAMICR